MNKTHVKTHEKRRKRKQNFQKFCEIFSSTRNDYERKINYDWPYR